MTAATCPAPTTVTVTDTVVQVDTVSAPPPAPDVSGTWDYGMQGSNTTNSRGGLARKGAEVGQFVVLQTAGGSVTGNYSGTSYIWYWGDLSGQYTAAPDSGQVTGALTSSTTISFSTAGCTYNGTLRPYNDSLYGTFSCDNALTGQWFANRVHD